MFWIHLVKMHNLLVEPCEKAVEWNWPDCSSKSQYAAGVLNDLLLCWIRSLILWYKVFISVFKLYINFPFWFCIKQIFMKKTVVQFITESRVIPKGIIMHENGSLYWVLLRCNFVASFPLQTSVYIFLQPFCCLLKLLKTHYMMIVSSSMFLFLSAAWPKDK